MSLTCPIPGSFGHPEDQVSSSHLLPLPSPSAILTANKMHVGDIGTAEDVLGKGLETPLQLPW